MLVVIYNTSISSFAITSKRKRTLVALLYMSSWCQVTVSVLCLFHGTGAVGRCDYGIFLPYSLTVCFIDCCCPYCVGVLCGCCFARITMFFLVLQSLH